MSNLKTCSSCKWYEHGVKDEFHCTNEFIHEDYYGEHNGHQACLVYPYNEGGRFYPGPNFGCVHHDPK